MNTTTNQASRVAEPDDERVAFLDLARMYCAVTETPSGDLEWSFAICDIENFATEVVAKHREAKARAALATQPAESKACASVGVGQEQLEADIAIAKKVLARLCDNGLVSMSIPVRQTDEDMTLVRVVDAAQKFAALASPAQAPAAPSVGEPVTRDTLRIGGRYNWKGQPERLVYMGLCEPRNGRWHQFAKVDAPTVCWSEVTDDDLRSFEATPPAAPAATEGASKLQNTAPRRIYLDIGDPFALRNILSGLTDWQVEGVTWSEDNATSHGVEYMRADLATPAPAVGASPEPANCNHNRLVCWNHDQTTGQCQDCNAVLPGPGLRLAKDKWEEGYNAGRAGGISRPLDLHPATSELVTNFSDALRDKLYAAQEKYGYSDGWLQSDWMDECRAKLLEHVAKGDPRDVAAYCAFLWHHNASTAIPAAANHAKGDES